MAVLNLSNYIESEIKYNINHFPDGQQDIIIEPIAYTTRYDRGEEYEAVTLNLFNQKYYIKIKSRLNSWKDLELIVAANKAIRRIKGIGQDEIHLEIPYLLGARSDREFVEGGNSYLVDVVAPVLNSQNFKTITVYDVHSDVAAACINNLKCIDNISLVKFAQEDLTLKVKYPEIALFDEHNYVLVSPDAGAMKKIYNVAEKCGFSNIVIANKHRDIKTGKILSTDVNLNNSQLNKNFIIVDDICDGGRTFIELAKVIKSQSPLSKIYLIVSHGIFSAGFKELKECFEGIYCTNSVQDIHNEYSDGYNIKSLNGLVKQLRVI